jgi:hypothetical protein
MIARCSGCASRKALGRFSVYRIDARSFLSKTWGVTSRGACQLSFKGFVLPAVRSGQEEAVKVAYLLAMGLALSSCSAAHSPNARYDELLKCEMAVLVVVNFHPSLGKDDRASLRAKLDGLSKSALSEAASIKKTNEEIATDQRRILTELQQRVQGSAGEAEAQKMVEEAKSCNK